MLTPVECERLQTLPDNYTSSHSAALRQAALPRTRQWLDGRCHRPPTVDTPAGGEAEAAQDHLHPLHRVNTKPQKQNHTPPLPPKTYVFSSLGLGQ